MIIFPFHKSFASEATEFDLELIPPANSQFFSIISKGTLLEKKEKKPTIVRFKDATTLIIVRKYQGFSRLLMGSAMPVINSCPINLYFQEERSIREIAASSHYRACLSQSKIICSITVLKRVLVDWLWRLFGRYLKRQD